MTTSGAIQRQKDDLAAGTEIGRYRIEEPVGRGGMGTVYAAFDRKTNRNVAVKLLAAGLPPSLRERFLAECEAEANIRHENVMPVYDRGWVSDEQPYFVMELLYEPITLTEIIAFVQKGNLGQAHPRLRQWNDLRRLMADVLLPICEGVAVANREYRVQHRDLKPDNVLIDIRTRRAYLIDFGICRTMDEADDAGKIVGTPRFLSPEQAAGRTDDRTDVWGLGALLRYAVTGEPPLAGTSPFSRQDVDNRIAALKQAESEAKAAGQEAKARGYASRREQLEDPTLRVQEDLVRDARDGIYLPLPEGMSAGLRAIIDKAMATDPADRYDHAGTLVDDLRTWLKGGSVQALAEAGRGGAAMDWVRRHLNRNVVRGVGTAAMLLLGWIIGTGLFTVTPPPPDHQAEDARARVEGIDQAVGAPPTTLADAPPVLGLLAEHTWLRQEREAAKARMAALGLPDPDLVGFRAAVGRWLNDPATLALQGWSAPEYVVDDLLRLPESGEAMKAATGTFFPGAYQVHGKGKGGLFLRFVVPPVPGLGFAKTDKGLVRTLLLDEGLGDVPTGMTWVPAGTLGPQDDRVIPAFMAGVHLVTNENYSEWLDDLPPEERAARVPPTGFARSQRDPRRWLAKAGEAMKPVHGVRPQDAAAYAAWRGRADGVTMRLPTAHEWQRMAGIESMTVPAADPIYPWRRATRHKVARRRGDAPPPTGEDVSPYGVRKLFSGGGELVQGAEAGTYEVRGRGGILPRVEAVARSEPVAADAADHGVGFRLVHGR